jgi:hypothetical protein
MDTRAILNSFKQILYTILDVTGLWWDGSFEYYQEKSKKVGCYFHCRKNIYTGKKYFRTMRPVFDWRDTNEWIEYEGTIDNNLY